MADPTPITINLVEFIIGIVSATIGICGFVFDQFRRTRAKASKEIRVLRKEIYRVLGRHNMEDDENFGAINDNTHAIMLHLGVDANFKSIRKRRWLSIDGGDIPEEEIGATGLHAFKVQDDEEGG